MGFPCGSAGKESARNVGDLGSIPGLQRSPREGKGYLLQYSGLENPMDCSLPGFSVHGITRVGHGLVTKPPPPYSPWSCKESNTTEQLCFTYRYILIHLPISCSLDILVATHLPPLSVISLFWSFHVSGIMQFAVICVCILNLA